MNLLFSAVFLLFFLTTLLTSFLPKYIYIRCGKGKSALHIMRVKKVSMNASANMLHCIIY